MSLHLNRELRDSGVHSRKCVAGVAHICNMLKYMSSELVLLYRWGETFGFDTSLALLA